MNHEFTIAFNTELLIDTPKCKIMTLSAGEEQLGYIALNTVVTESGSETTIAPFTSKGLQDDACCIGCAAKTLFKLRTGFELKFISIAETESAAPSIAKVLPLLLLAELAARAKSL